MCAFYSVTRHEPDRDWLSEHMDRADGATWICYVMAGTATLP